MLPADMYRRQKVRIDRRAEDAGPYTYANEARSAWEDAETVATRRAAFRPDVLRKQMEEGRLTSGITGVVTLRADSTIAAVTTADRMVLLYAPYANLTMEILSVMPTADTMEVEFAVQQVKD